MTVSLGYKLSSEEQSPADLVRQAQMAEDTGFEFAHEQEILPELTTLHSGAGRSRRRPRAR